MLVAAFHSGWLCLLRLAIGDTHIIFFAYIFVFPYTCLLASVCCLLCVYRLSFLSLFPYSFLLYLGRNGGEVPSTQVWFQAERGIGIV